MLGLDRMRLRRSLVFWLCLSATACSCGNAANPAPDASGTDGGTGTGVIVTGTADAGTADAGTADAGTADAGTQDGGSADGGLPPESAACANHRGTPNDCWGEWLKETGTPIFGPQPVGGLGAGPWPTAALEVWGSAEGIPEPILGVSTDLAENVYAVSSDALYVRRVGEPTFTGYARNTNGLRDYPLLSVAGGAAGVAYVGYEGDCNFDLDTDPIDVKRSGDVQKVVLTPTGITATTWDTHNSNSPLSGYFDHSRCIFRIVVPRHGLAAGEIYLGTEHGVVRYQGEVKYADHRHIATLVDGSQHFGSVLGLSVSDTGTVWFGNDYQLGGLAYTPRLYEWYFDDPWIFPGNAFGAEGDRNQYVGVVQDSKGNVWAAAQGHGLAHLIVSPSGRSATVETLSVPDSAINHLVIDGDDTLWLATDSGVYHSDQNGQSWQKLAGAGGHAYELFIDDLVTPRTVWVATSEGVVAYRVP